MSSLRSGLRRFEISHMIIPTRSLKINYWLYWSILSFSERFKAKATMKIFACLIYFAAGFSGPCAQHNDYIKRNFSPKNMANIFVPKVQEFNAWQSIYTDIWILEKCSSDGYYAEVQCRYGYCQCMQRDGQYIQVDCIETSVNRTNFLGNTTRICRCWRAWLWPKRRFAYHNKEKLIIYLLGLTVRWQLCSNRVWGERSLVALGSESNSSPKLVIR